MDYYDLIYILKFGSWKLKFWDSIKKLFGSCYGNLLGSFFEKFVCVGRCLIKLLEGG